MNNHRFLGKTIGLFVACLCASLGFATEGDYTDERVTISNLPSGFVPAPKDLGDGFWAYVFDKPATDMVITVRKNLVISRALVVGGGGSGGITWAGGGGGGGVWTNDAPIDIVSGAMISVSVGAGGEKLAATADWTQTGNNGGTSRFVIGGTTYEAVGGGGGASFSAPVGCDGANGGGGSGNYGAGGQATMTGGHPGAQAGLAGYAGGGGGAGADANGGHGGEGATNDITGEAKTYGSGGGGSNGSDGGVGGTNAGDGNFTSFGGDAADGFGGGGGGGGYNGIGYPGGKGGDGTVVLVFYDPELPAAHVSAETSGDYSHAVEVTVDKLGEGASSATVSLAYGLAGGSLGPYRTVKENVTAGEVVPCPMTNLPAGSYRYAVKIANNLGKEKVVEGRFRVVDLPPEDATGERIGLKGDVVVIDLSRNAKGNFVCRPYKDVDMGAFNCDVYKTKKMVLRRIPAREEGYPCRPRWVGDLPTALATNEVKVVHKTYGFSIFPITREQFVRVMGQDPNVDEPMRFDYEHTYNNVRGNNYQSNIAGPVEWSNPGHWWFGYPNYMNPTNQVTTDSFMGILSAKCVNEAGQPVGSFDLPTELQWEIAARAGSFATYGSFWNVSEQRVVEGNDLNASLYTPIYTCPSIVGTLAPNAWGIYDTQGAYWEMCLDVFSDPPATNVEEAVSTEVPDGHRLDYLGKYETYGGERVLHGYQYQYGSGLRYHNPSQRSYWRANDPTIFNTGAPAHISYRVMCYLDDLPPPPPREDVKLWITDHADAGDGYVYLAFQPILPSGSLDVDYVLRLDREKRIQHQWVVGGVTNTVPATLRDPTGQMDLDRGWIWVKVMQPETINPYEYQLGKILILDAAAE